MINGFFIVFLLSNQVDLQQMCQMLPPERGWLSVLKSGQPWLKMKHRRAREDRGVNRKPGIPQMRKRPDRAATAGQFIRKG